MPRNASGVYSKPAGTTAVTGTTISSSDFNTLMDDIASDLNIARPVVAGGTGASNAADARTELGLGIGTDILAHDDAVQALAGNTPAADKLPYYTGAATSDLADLTAFIRTLLDDADAETARATLELVIGTDVQAFNDDLATISGITFQRGDIIFRNDTSLNRLPVGAAGKVLSSSGVDVFWGDPPSVPVLDMVWGRPTGSNINDDFPFGSTHVGTIDVYGMAHDTTLNKYVSVASGAVSASGTWASKSGALSLTRYEKPQGLLWMRTA